MSHTLLQRVRVLDPGGPHDGQTVNIRFSDRGIDHISEEASPAGELPDRVIDGVNTFVSPGWVDTGVTLCDPGEEWKETQSALATAAIRGGFTTLLPYPSSHPTPDKSEPIRALLAHFAKLPIHVLPLGAITEGRHGIEMAELYDMHIAGAIAFADGPLAFPEEGILLRVLRYMQSFGGLLMTGAILPTWIEQGYMHEGDAAIALGMPGIPAVFEKIAVQRDLDILRYQGTGSIHFQPLSTPDAVKAVAEARREGLNVTAGVPMYLFAWQDQDLSSFDENLKVLPPLRSAEIIQALKAQVSCGDIDLLCTGHKAEGAEEKLVEFQQAATGMLNLQTAFSQAVSHLIESGIMDLKKWVELIATNPRQRFGLPAAHIQVGGEEFTWFSPSSAWTLTTKEIPSRAKNTPHLGQQLQGKALGVFAKGRFHHNS